MHKHIKLLFRKIPKFKKIYSHKKNDNVTITAGSILTDPAVWKINKDYGSTMKNNIISLSNSASSAGANGGGLLNIDNKLANLNFGKKKKIKF